MRRRRVLIAGLGNVLMTDDGAGVHALRLLEADPPNGVELLDVGTAFVRASSILEGADAIVALDAVDGGGPAGTAYALNGRDAAVNEGGGLHGLGLMGALSLAGAGEPEVLVLGVQPANLDYGMEPSPEVGAALEGLARAAARAAGMMADGARVDEAIAALRKT